MGHELSDVQIAPDQIANNSVHAVIIWQNDPNQTICSALTKIMLTISTSSCLSDMFLTIVFRKGARCITTKYEVMNQYSLLRICIRLTLRCAKPD